MVERISYFATQSSSSVQMLVAIVVMTIAGMAAVYYVWDLLNRKHPGGKNANIPIWDELCAAHRLTKQDRELLVELARLHQLPQKEMLFVRPDLFTAEGTHLQPQSATIAQLKSRMMNIE